MAENKTRHRITQVLPGSIAEEMEIEPGDVLLSIDGQAVEDILDYRFLTNEEFLVIEIEKSSREIWELEIEKEYEEDLGIVFENPLMDGYRSCSNRCVFCFIDQMPPGMRPTLYFKDDDSRLSFLQGNYVTLTNMDDHDIDRIIRYRMEPINISFHTMNPSLRVKMLRNRFAGDIFDRVRKLALSGIEMNGQIVLCRGINDGEELEHSLAAFEEYLPALRSVSVVPVGLTKYREGLCELVPFDRESAGQVLEQIRRWQAYYLEKHGTHLVHASDEWYILAGQPLPETENYDGYLQLENGVGMLRLLMEEAGERLRELTGPDGSVDEVREDTGSVHAGTQNEYGQTQNSSIQAQSSDGQTQNRGIQAQRSDSQTQNSNIQAQSSDGQERGISAGPPRTCSIATGELAAPFIREIRDGVRAVFPNTVCRVYTVKNRFFGERITVSGLLTGQDLALALAGQELGEELLLPVNMFRSGEEVFLDDMTAEQLSGRLGVRIRIVDTPGAALVDAILGLPGGALADSVPGLPGGAAEEREGCA